MFAGQVPLLNVVVLNHKYSIVPEPPVGKLTLVNFAGVFPEHKLRSAPIVPPLVTLSQHGPVTVTLTAFDSPT